MALFKIVNGQRVQCSASEESNILADWEIGRLNSESNRARRQNDTVIKESLIAKMVSGLNLTEEEESLFTKAVFPELLADL